MSHLTLDSSDRRNDDGRSLIPKLHPLVIPNIVMEKFNQFADTSSCVWKKPPTTDITDEGNSMAGKLNKKRYFLKSFFPTRSIGTRAYKATKNFKALAPSWSSDSCRLPCPFSSCPSPCQ